MTVSAVARSAEMAEGDTSARKRSKWADRVKEDRSLLTDSDTSRSGGEHVQEQVRVGCVEPIHVLLSLGLRGVSVESDVWQILEREEKD